MKNYLLIILSVISLSSCGISFNKFNSMDGIRGIVKIKNYNNSLVRFTHRNQRNTIKAIPIIISTGISVDSSIFTMIEFKSFNKNEPINFSKIEMYNGKKHKWEWIVDDRRRSTKRNKYFIEESHNTFITSKEDELYQFFDHPPIYLKLIGRKENFKKLDYVHLESLKKILKYSKILNSSVKI